MNPDDIKKLTEALTTLEDAIIDKAKQDLKLTAEEKAQKDKEKRAREEDRQKRKEEQDTRRDLISTFQGVKKIFTMAADLQQKANRINFSLSEVNNLNLSKQPTIFGAMAASLKDMGGALAQSTAAVQANTAGLTAASGTGVAPKTVTTTSYTLDLEDMQEDTKKALQRKLEAEDAYLDLRADPDVASSSPELQEARKVMQDLTDQYEVLAERDAKAAGKFTTTTETVGGTEPTQAAEQMATAASGLSENLATNSRAVTAAAQSFEDVVPGQAAMATKMALVNNGLENNAEGLGMFLARSKVLGENIEAMAGNLRTLRNTLVLGQDQEASFADAIGDFAKTYRTSSESLVQALQRNAETLALAGAAGGEQTQKLMTQLMAMSDREAPQQMEKILSQMFGSGMESIQRMAVLGVGEEAQRIMSGGGDISDMKAILQAITDMKDSVVGQGNDAIVGNEILKSILGGMTVADANNAQTLLGILDRQEEQVIQNAGMKDVMTGMYTLFQMVEGGITQVATFIGGLAEKLFNLLGPYVMQLVGIFLSVFAVVRALGPIVGLLKTILSISRIMQALALLRTTVLGTMGWWIVAIAAAITAVAAYFGFLSDKTEENEENTAVVANKVKKEEAESFQNKLEEYNNRANAALNDLIKMAAKSDVDQEMTSLGAAAQQEQNNRYLAEVLTELREQKELMIGRRSAFAGAGSNGDGKS